MKAAVCGNRDRHKCWTMGFTLIELMVVLAIVGILSALAIPKFLTSMGESQLDADANRLMLDLQWAKSAGPKLSSGPNRADTLLFVILDATHKSWTIYKDNGDNTFNAATDAMVKRDSLAGTSRFGFSSDFPTPSAVDLPVGASAAVAPGGFGDVDPASVESCRDIAATATAPTWADATTGGGKIVICGGTVGDMSSGALYLTSTRSKNKAYAILFNKYTAGSSSYSLRKYVWNSAGWTKQ